MSDDHLSIAQLEQQIDSLSADIENAQDRGVTVMPEQVSRLMGLRKLLEVKRKALNAGTDD